MRRFLGAWDAEAVSIALRARAESLGHTWNPLLFGNDVKCGVVHFSLLPDGRPNVAINTGEQNWTHRTARTAVAVGQWHHLDPRLRRAVWVDSVRFYVDGKLVGEERLSLGIRLDLDGFPPRCVESVGRNARRTISMARFATSAFTAAC